VKAKIIIKVRNILKTRNTVVLAKKLTKILFLSGENVVDFKLK